VSDSSGTKRGAKFDPTIPNVATAAESDWGWTGGKASIAFDLAFVRDVPVESVIGAFGMDPAAAKLIPQAGDDKPYQYMFHDDRLGATYVPWIRAGRAGEWVFVISPILAEVAAVPDAVRELSRAGAAVWCAWNIKMDSLWYFEDGVQVTWFEPLRAYDRRGSDPDRFVPQMRQARLPVDGDPDSYDRDFRICALEMLTLALGIRVPAEVAYGPLLTVQRGR
jgi:hypothetical protein